ncbi:MAG TPA: rhodanese-like domain-containing protein [Ohtaekwangia sp.]|uniref:sulfurtransferase n=1 Tax=Ohtaekwangia sp. TaxID=2066019 RepID=UPI002F943FC0
MKKLIFFAVLITIAIAARAQESILVTAGWLKEHINDPDLVILQIGYLKLDYEKEHIAGSQFLWPGWLAPDSPEGSFNAPDPAAATELLQKMGISGNSRVVLCHVRNEVSVAARMFLTLEDLGLKGRVFWLNGGLDAWKKEGNPVTDKVTVAKRGNFKAKLADLLVDKVYVQKAMQASNQVIVDARMQKYYDGSEPTGLPRDGHIPGARNIPYPDMIDEANMFKPTAKLQEYFTPVADKDKELVAYCFIGQTASVVYMAGRILGYKMKLYDGSLQEWTRIAELPMEVTKKEQ